MKIRILIIDPSRDIYDALHHRMKDQCTLTHIRSISEADWFLHSLSIDCIVSELYLTDGSGEQILSIIQGLLVHPPVIFYSENLDSDRIQHLINLGADLIIHKSISIEQIQYKIEKSIICSHHYYQKHFLSNPDESDNIIGNSSQIIRVKHLIRKYGPSHYPVLIQGESGTGKELIAQALHKRSSRFKQAYLAFSCVSIPDGIIESELFGTEKGAYTGAVQRKGLFETADNGTLFLDEIGDLPPNSQVKLLRVLEDNSLYHLGGRSRIHIDVRLITATHKNLKEEVERNSFRLDLFYRINTLVIEVPPLRQRKEDIFALAVFFLGKSGKRITVSSMEKLSDHPWPGNVRELKSVIERSVLHSKDSYIQPGDIIFH